MNFGSYAELARDIPLWSVRLPQDFDAIVGIPRSGVMVAHLLALHRNCMVGELHSFVARPGHVSPTGGRGKKYRRYGTPRKILIVDDCCNTGGSIGRAKKLLAPIANRFDISYGAVYATIRSTKYADYYLKTVEHPRCWEWNLFHCAVMRSSCVDIDGLLCPDPTGAQNDDGPKYIDFMANTKPLHRPTVEIAQLVTSRLERFRPQTEAWLKKQEIPYRNLVMAQYATGAERRKAGRHARDKAEAYMETNARLFIESNTKQAQGIFKVSGKPVLCSETMKMFK